MTTAGLRGRIDKRLAILDAAITVFAREGYAQAGVDAIAAAAGVAKATVYSHFGDKARLLREALAAETDRAAAANLEVVERLLEVTARAELQATLEDVGLRLLECFVEERSWALRRLVAAEVVQFPELADVFLGRAAERVNQALADRLLSLSVAGWLRVDDPAVAAEQFGGLLTGGMEARTRIGTRVVPAAELRAVARAAVTTFLRAFAP